MATHVETRPGAGGQHPVRLGPVAFSGFPVRSLTRQIRGTSDGGEWITAYQMEQSRRLRAVVSSSVRETDSAKARRALKPPTNTREVSGVPKKLLNGSFLLKHCCVEEPPDLCVCNISGEGLRVHRAEDLALFDNVVYINASENQLPLEAFRTFPVLQELELSLNGVLDISIQSRDFTKLMCLDLSYNTISGLALLSLGTLPALKELHLTGNNIVALPVEMSRPVSLAGTEGSLQKAKMRFPALERLWLDDNKLTDQATFATLAGLRKLKYLNLDHNEIFIIPLLKLIGTSPLKNSKRTDHANPVQTGPDNWDMRFDDTPPPSPLATVRPVNKSGSLPGSRPQTRDKLSGSNLRERPHGNSTPPAATQSKTNQRSAASPDADAKSRSAHETTPQRSPLATPKRALHKQQRSDLSIDSREAFPPVQTHQDTTLSASVATPPAFPPHSMAPFPELHTLSLANNVILTSEGVLACGSWPALKKLLIHGNPLTRTSKGMPLLLQTHLVEQCGISVIRHKQSSGKQYLIGKAAKDFKKVSAAPPPTIPKQPLLPALEAPPSLDTLMLEYPSPSSSLSSRSPSHSPAYSLHSHTSSYHSDIERGGAAAEGERRPDWTKPEGEENNEQQGVFLTQPSGEELEQQQAKRSSPRDGSDKPWSVREEFQAKRKAAKVKYKDLPEHYRGYEMLMDTYEDPSMPIPADIHSCTRALQYALKHPLVLADSSSKPSSQPRPRVIAGKFLKRKPSAVSLKPGVSSKISEMQHVLDDIRNCCVALEANVGEVLHQKTSPESKSLSQLQRESRQLLAEMQSRYDQVRTSSMKMLRSLSEHSSPPSWSHRTSASRSPLTPPSPSRGRDRARSTSPYHSSDTHSMS